MSCYANHPVRRSLNDHYGKSLGDRGTMYKHVAKLSLGAIVDGKRGGPLASMGLLREVQRYAAGWLPFVPPERINGALPMHGCFDE